MCQVQAGAYVSILTPGETKYSDCHPRKTTTYVLRVVSITTHTHDRHKSIQDQGHGRGGTPVFTGLFEPLARVTLYLTDENGLGSCFRAA